MDFGGFAMFNQVDLSLVISIGINVFILAFMAYMMNKRTLEAINEVVIKFGEIIAKLNNRVASLEAQLEAANSGKPADEPLVSS